MTAENGASYPAKILPEQRVGAAMRQARELAGISLRQIAKDLGYHSHTTLSSYERGAVMPTDEAVRGYEQLLGLVRQRQFVIFDVSGVNGAATA